MNLLFTLNLLLDANNINNENEIELSPVVLKLQDEIKTLRTSLSDIILKRDELKYIICKNIETDYWLIFGELEKNLYEVSTRVLRLKRKINLVQAYKNREENVDLEKIEKLLDEEFVKYQKKLEEYIQNIKLAREFNSLEALSEEDSKKLKMLYLKIIKLLHPDLKSDYSPIDKFLFQKALDAYRNADLKTIIAIDALLSSKDFSVSSKNSIESLEEEKEKLESLIENIESEIINIKNYMPYILKYIIDSPDTIEKRKEELLMAIADFSERETIYRVKLRDMLGD